jgi:hypothetical protein
MQQALIALLSARTGHFLFESSHHGNLWLDLDDLRSLNPWLRPQDLFEAPS